MISSFLDRNRRRRRIARFLRVFDLTIRILPTVSNFSVAIAQVYAKAWRGPHAG